MEEKLAKYSARAVCAFCIFACVLVWFLPALDEFAAAFRLQLTKDQREREARYAMLEKMSGLEILDYNTQQIQNGNGKGNAGSSEIGFSQQIRLELPEGTDGGSVVISAEPVKQEIQIQIPGADLNYLYDYSLVGKSDGINNLSYYSEDGIGMIVLTMDSVVEAEGSYDDSYFYLDFIDPHEIYDYIVVIDAGHGGSMPGAVAGSIYEKDINLAIVQKFKALVDEIGGERIGFYYTRLDDTNPELSERVGLANKINAHLFISVHINSLSGQTKVEGTEVMYDEKAVDTAFDTKDFAQICQEEEVAALGSKDLGIINGNSIYIIRNANMPVALVEVGFLNNPEERALLIDADYQQKAAQGIYNAILRSVDRLEELE